MSDFMILSEQLFLKVQVNMNTLTSQIFWQDASTTDIETYSYLDLICASSSCTCWNCALLFDSLSVLYWLNVVIRLLTTCACCLFSSSNFASSSSISCWSVCVLSSTRGAYSRSFDSCFCFKSFLRNSVLVPRYVTPLFSLQNTIIWIVTCVLQGMSH